MAKGLPQPAGTAILNNMDELSETEKAYKAFRESIDHDVKSKMRRTWDGLDMNSNQPEAPTSDFIPGVTPTIEATPHIIEPEPPSNPMDAVPKLRKKRGRYKTKKRILTLALAQIQPPAEPPSPEQAADPSHRTEPTPSSSPSRMPSTVPDDQPASEQAQEPQESPGHSPL